MSNPIVDSVIGIASKVADKFFPDAKDKEAFQLEMTKQLQAMDMAELDLSKSAIVAEATSQDKWTSRARPSFMYVIYILLLFSMPYGIWFAIHPISANNFTVGMAAWFKAIPDILYQLFGVGYVGYSASRSYDKMSALKHGKK
jgi:hypothetical protein